MYSNRGVYLCNVIFIKILVIIIQQFITQIKNNISERNLAVYSKKKFKIYRTKLYLNLFRFNIFIVRCLGDYFFPDTVYEVKNSKAALMCF